MTVTKAKWLRLWEIKTELLEAEDEKVSKTEISENLDWEQTLDIELPVENSEWQEISEPENIGIENDEIEDSSFDEEYNAGDLPVSDESQNIQIQPKIESFDFEIPNNIQQIQLLKKILTENPWDTKIRIWGIEKLVSLGWLEKIRDLLQWDN